MFLPKEVQLDCEQILGTKIISVHLISSGDINEVRLIKTKSDSFFVKTNNVSSAYEMFQKEIFGLNLLRKSNSIKIPEIIGIGKAKSTAFLILEYINSENSNSIFWENFGQQLSQLHRFSHTHFGLDHSNFIGSLYQSNKMHSTWYEFFIKERLIPQVELAKKSNLLPSSTLLHFDIFYKKIKDIFPNEKPSLIHGDLWNGNFLIGEKSNPVLIDPSVCFGHREMDLAITMLFGGFDKRFYEAYDNSFPLQPDFEKRVQVYQVYYLLVHVNIFGKGYIPSLNRILNSFT